MKLNRIVIFLCLFAFGPVCFSIGPSDQEEIDYRDRLNRRNEIILKIEDATRKRCPHKIINDKVIALCHGEESWKKKVDCDHQNLLKVSEFYQQSIKPTACHSDESFSEIKWKKGDQELSINRKGIGIWLGQNPQNIDPPSPYPLIPIDIDLHQNKKNAELYTVIVKQNARNRPICEINKEDIIDVVKFHDPNCDLEILSETSKINFINFTDEDIYQIFVSLNAISTQAGGCIDSISDLLLLKDRDCLAYNPRFNAEATDPFIEFPAGSNFLDKIKANSHAGGAMDFSAGSRISGKRHTFYIYDGKVFNYRDFGNFLWGLAYRLASCNKDKICEKQAPIECHATFLNKKIALAGANFNAFFHTYKENMKNATGCSSPPVEGEEENTIILQGDSAPDQAAIKLGLTHPVGNFILQSAKETYCKELSAL